jgi:hypothetical protein
MAARSDGPAPIETSYGGYRFRSRHEARWGVFFSTLDVAWEYEPQGYYLGGGARRYLPDFLLPDHGLYVEVKPTDADLVDPEGVELWNVFAGEVAVSWKERRSVMFVGPIPDPATVDSAGPPRGERWYDPGIVILGDWHYAWCACPSGRHFDVQSEARGGRIYCGCPRQLDDSYQTGDHPALLAAYGAARAARFEHGENPATAWPTSRAS